MIIDYKFFKNLLLTTSETFEISMHKQTLTITFDFYFMNLNRLNALIKDFFVKLSDIYEWDTEKITLSVSNENTILVSILLKNFDDIIDEIPEL